MDKNKRGDYGIPLLIVLSIMLFAIFIFYITREGTEILRINCAPGQCATNIYSGEKRCPNEQDIVASIDPSIEVCNSPFACENILTPYAIQSDGSTSLTGLCDVDVQCKCVQRPRCASYITSYFESVNGNPNLPIDSQRIVYRQVESYNNLANEYEVISPLEYTDPSMQFCKVPYDWVAKQRIWPTKCISGTLVYLPDDPLTFNRDVLEETPLACVRGDGTECDEGYSPFWDTSLNMIRCLPPPGPI